MSTVGKPHNNSWLMRFRKYHTWIGLALLVPFLVLAASGIMLNHKDTFLGKKEKEKDHGPSDAAGAKGDKPSKETDPRFRTTMHASALPVDLDAALAAAREQLGDRPLERIEIRPDHGRIVYKFRADKHEVVIDSEAGEISQSLFAREKPVEEKKKNPDDPTDWRKFIKDLHTGKLGGLTGMLAVDFAALCLGFVSLTGLYLWVVPKLRKKRAARERAALVARLAEECKTPATV